MYNIFLKRTTEAKKQTNKKNAREHSHTHEHHFSSLQPKAEVLTCAAKEAELASTSPKSASGFKTYVRDGGR